MFFGVLLLNHDAMPSFEKIEFEKKESVFVKCFLLFFKVIQMRCYVLPWKKNWIWKRNIFVEYFLLFKGHSNTMLFSFEKTEFDNNHFPEMFPNFFFKVIQIHLRPRMHPACGDKEPNFLGLIGVAIALPPLCLSEMALPCHSTVFRLSRDFSIRSIEQNRTMSKLGATVDRSLYHYTHPGDLERLQRCHIEGTCLMFKLTSYQAQILTLVWIWRVGFSNNMIQIWVISIRNSQIWNSRTFYSCASRKMTLVESSFHKSWIREEKNLVNESSPNLKLKIENFRDANNVLSARNFFPRYHDV